MIRRTMLVALALTGVLSTASAQVSAPGDKLVFIVRHAEKANATDPDPSLSVEAILVVGHSNTVSAIIAALGGPTMPDLCDASYANLYVMHIPATGAPTLVRTLYGAPDHAEASSCAGMTVR